MTHRWLGTPLCNNSLLDHTDVLRFVYNLLTLALFVPVFNNETTPTAEILELSSGPNYPALVKYMALVLYLLMCWLILKCSSATLQHSNTFLGGRRANFDCGLERETAQKRGLSSEKFAHR